MFCINDNEDRNNNACVLIIFWEVIIIVLQYGIKYGNGLWNWKLENTVIIFVN